MPSLEKASYVCDLSEVLLRVDRKHARRRAPLDLMLEARARSQSELGVGARAELEVTVDQPERLSRGGRRVVRAEVLRSIRFRTPYDFQPRPRLARVESQGQVFFVVAELDVVLRLMCLDELVFEQCGFLVGVGDERLDVGELALEPADERAKVTRALLEVATDSVSQATGLADVEHFVVGAMEHVHARRGRERIELSLGRRGYHRKSIPPPEARAAPRFIRGGSRARR